MKDKSSFTVHQIFKVKLQLCLVNLLIHLIQYHINIGTNGLTHVKPTRTAEKEVELRTNGALLHTGMSLEMGELGPPPQLVTPQKRMLARKTKTLQHLPLKMSTTKILMSSVILSIIGARVADMEEMEIETLRKIWEQECSLNKVKMVE